MQTHLSNVTAVVPENRSSDAPRTSKPYHSYTSDLRADAPQHYTMGVPQHLLRGLTVALL